jgi:long-chain acyl-CoA synthetase
LTQPFDRGKIREWTFAQVADESRRVAEWLRAQGWEPGTRIGILSKNCAWWILSDLAIWMAGYVTVPVYPSLKAPSVRQILEHSGARACFVGPVDDAETLNGIPPGVISISFPNGPRPQWDSLVAGTEPIAGNPTRAATDLATIIYTSGTTGTPKAVMHSFGAFAFNAAGLCHLLHLTSEERILSYLPLAHIVERAGMEVAALYLGSQIFFTEGIDTFLTDLARARPTIFLSVPRLLVKFQQGVFSKIPKKKLEMLLGMPLVNLLVKRRILRQLGLGTVQHAASGAAPLPPEILLWYRKLGLDLAEGYGMTETLITHLPARGQVRAGYVGPALPGVFCRVADGGELQIRSPMNMLGYYKDPESTRAVFTDDGFFRTGDMAQIDVDGQLKIVGRLKEQFKTSKGKYVAPAPIESRLSAHPAVDACCLMGSGLPSPFAAVVLSEEARKRCANSSERAGLEQSLVAQMEAVNADLDPHERVAFLAIVDGPWSIGNGCMTPTLKIRRPVVESRYLGLVEDWKNQNRPVVWEGMPENAGASQAPARSG